MRRGLRPLIRAVGAPVAGVAVTILRCSKRAAGVAVLYHSTAQPVRDPELEIVPPHPPRLFAAQLRHLRRWYRVVDAADLLEAISERRRFGRFPVAITFDDDLPEHVTVALPILERNGLQATFFLCGKSLDAPFSFWWERLQRAMDVDGRRAVELVAARSPERVTTDSAVHELAQAIEDLTPTQRAVLADDLGALVGPDPEDAGLRASGVQRLARAGMTIGFHTMHHDPLDSLDHEELSRALRNGRDRLAAVAGSDPAVIAYPHGRTNLAVAEAARSAGFRIGFSAAGLPARPDDHPLLIPRITPSYRSVGHFAAQLVLCLRSASRRTMP